jgi:hypothetical protein
MPDAVAAPAVAERMRQAHVRWLICSTEGDRDDVIEGRIAYVDRLSAYPADPAVPLEDRFSVDRLSLRLSESFRAAAPRRPQDLGWILVVVARTGWSLGAVSLMPDRVGASAAMRIDRSARIRVAGLAKADPVSFGARELDERLALVTASAALFGLPAVLAEQRGRLIR